MSALFFDEAISSHKNGFTLFMKLDIFSHVDLSKSSLEGNRNDYNIKLMIYDDIHWMMTSQ